MKYIKIKISFLLIIVITLMISSQVYAKTSIEIKPNGNLYTNKTISEFFDESMAMKNTGECLEGSNVDVHMATNLDWAIVSYFSNSAYGTNGEGKNTGTSITIDGSSGHYSTNGNITGVIDFGRTLTYTAGLRNDYKDISDEIVKGNMLSLIENAGNINYVDIVPLLWNKSKKDIAATGWYSAGISTAGAIVTERRGLFGLSSNTGYNSSCTFRPVINSRT